MKSTIMDVSKNKLIDMYKIMLGPHRKTKSKQSINSVFSIISKQSIIQHFVYIFKNKPVSYPKWENVVFTNTIGFMWTQ